MVPPTETAASRSAIASMGTGLAVTVTVQVALLPPAVAVMVVVPTPTAVTLPVWSTVATFVLPLFQVTVLSSAFAGTTVAVSCFVLPTTSAVLVSFSVTAETGSFTVTSQVAV